MKFTSLITLLVLPCWIYGQLSGHIGLGYDRFTNNYGDYRRINGLTLNFILENRLSDIFSLNYGIGINLAQEEYYFYSYHVSNISDNFLGWSRVSTTLVDMSENYSLSIKYPVSITSKLYKNRLFLNSGILLSIDNLKVFSDAFRSDPEYTNPPSPNDPFLPDWPKSALGFGHYIGLMYCPINKLGVIFEWQTIKNRFFEFSNLEIRMQYRIFTNR